MYSGTYTQATDVQRLIDLGATSYVAEAMFDQVDIDKVEALVLVRNCPIELALRIARYV